MARPDHLNEDQLKTLNTDGYVQICNGGGKILHEVETSVEEIKKILGDKSSGQAFEKLIELVNSQS